MNLACLFLRLVPQVFCIFLKVHSLSWSALCKISLDLDYFHKNFSISQNSLGLKSLIYYSHWFLLKLWFILEWNPNKIELWFDLYFLKIYCTKCKRTNCIQMAAHSSTISNNFETTNVFQIDIYLAHVFLFQEHIIQLWSFYFKLSSQKVFIVENYS